MAEKEANGDDTNDALLWFTVCSSSCLQLHGVKLRPSSLSLLICGNISCWSLLIQTSGLTHLVTKQNSQDSSQQLQDQTHSQSIHELGQNRKSNYKPFVINKKDHTLINYMHLNDPFNGLLTFRHHLVVKIFVSLNGITVFSGV